MNLLIVEDDANIRSLLSYYLQDALKIPYITFTDTAEGAIKRLAFARYKAVVLDYFLSEGNAQCIVNFIHELKEQPAVILFTASNKYEAIAKQIQASEIITKPFDLDNFEKIVRKYIDITA